MGPLRIHPLNPRYFTDDGRRAIVLTGSHHWDNLVDNDERSGPFDFTAYLDLLEGFGHNFIRLWAQWGWIYPTRPLIYRRTGPGQGVDGEARFDLEQFEPEYFDRLRERVQMAGRRGLYVSVMLFQGWSLRDHGEGDPWYHHPYHHGNNVNGINGDPRGREDGVDVHTLHDPVITRLQEAYVERVLDAVNDLDNVLFEISNESPGESFEWQCHMVRYLREAEHRRAKQHPVGMTAVYSRGRNADLLSSPADWISPDRRGGYRTLPPPADGSRVVLLDTDHLWGIGGDARWVWKSFLRGHHPIYMDPLDDESERDSVRRAMGQVQRLADRLPLAEMVPDTKLSSSKFCLSRRGGARLGEEEILVYSPWSRRVRLRLGSVAGELRGEWIEPVSGATAAVRVAGGATRALVSPFRGGALLHLKAG